MRQSCATTIWLTCFFSLMVGSRSFVFAQESPQTSEKERGIELYRKGDFNGAVNALQKAVKTQQRDSDAWYYLGLSLHQSGNVKDARKAFEKSIASNPNVAPGYTALAYMLLLDNDNKGAERNAEKAITLDPKNFESFYIAGAARLRQGAPAEALSRAEEALKVKPDYSPALILKTESLVNIFARERALLVGKRTKPKENDPSAAAAREEKSRAEYSLLKSASESLESCLKLNPQQSENVMWREQLETLRFYAQKAEGAKSDVYAPGMTAALRPTILYREKAIYTDAARNAGVRGTVALQVVFADDGVIKHILVIQGLSHGLTEQAIVAAHKIRFTPAMRDGKPVSVIGTLEYTFDLY